MSHEKNSVYVVVILIALFGVILSCCGGMFGGFVAGALTAESVIARRVRLEAHPSPYPPRQGWPDDKGEKPPSRAPNTYPTPQLSLPPEEGFPLEEIPPEAFWESGHSGGALVLEVNPGGPAERAGFRKGDIVVAVNGEALTPGELLSDLIIAEKPGDKVAIHYWRSGRDRSVIVTLGENPENADQAYLGVLFVPVPLPETEEAE